MGINIDFVPIDFSNFVPKSADSSDKFLFAENVNGQIGILRILGNYTIEQQALQVELVFKAGENIRLNKRHAVYVLLRIDKNGKSFAMDFLKKLDEASLERIVE